MDEIKLEKNIPLPKRKWSLIRGEIDEMEIGDSFAFSGKNYGRIQMSLSKQKKRNAEFNYTCRKMLGLGLGEDGHPQFRAWRIDVVKTIAKKARRCKSNL